MTLLQKKILLQQIVWDYNIPVDEIEDVLKGHKHMTGHYTRNMLFRKLLETYPWFTLIEMFTPVELKLMLNNEVINTLRAPSLQKKYGFVQKRLQEIIPAAG